MRKPATTTVLCGFPCCPRMRFLLLAATAGLLLAGCVTPPDATTASTGAPADVVMVAGAFPALDARATLDEVRSFSEAFPMRRGDNDAHKAARAYLEAAYKEAGYSDVFQDEYVADVSVTSTPTNALGSGRLANVCAMKWGATLPEEWVVVGAHFDVTDGAIYGAYDDASGTMIVQHLARAFANVTTARTIVFCNFDGEEQGLTGSSHVVEALANGEWIHNNGTVVGMVDFDMAGITYPAPAPLVADVRSPEMKAIIGREAARLGFPEAMVEYRAVRGGSSDNGPFKAAEIPSVLLISGFDQTSLPQATLPVSYPFWHQLDTYEGMVQIAGGEENLQAGFQNVEDIGSALLYEMAGAMTLTFE